VDELRPTGADAQVVSRTTEAKTKQVSNFPPFLDTFKIGRSIHPSQEHAILAMLSRIDGVSWKTATPKQPGFLVNLRSQMDAIHPNRLNTGMGMEWRPEPGFHNGKETLTIRFRLDEGPDHFLAVSV
jgi:hypothetical protein